jgi:dolichyl-phosphate beta-glucosyltransferase
MPFLSVVIPAYNESERLPQTLDMIRQYLATKDFTAEVLVVDDGSFDGTADVAEAFAADFRQLRVIRNAANKGKGGVVRQGMLEAKGTWRLFMDADHSTPITEFDSFIPLLPKADVLIGSRYLRPDSIKVKQSLKRRIGSRAFNRLVQWVALPGIVDTQCGFKLFSATAAEAIFPKQTLNGWSFDAEILTIARELQYRIVEVPVDWYDATQSKFRARSTAFKLIKDIRYIRRNISARTYAQKAGNN